MNNFIPATINVKLPIPFKGIYYIGQYGTSGYASAARGYLFEWFSKGIPITWEPLYFDDSKLSNDDLYDIVIKSLIEKNIPGYEMVVMHSTPDLWPEMLIGHQSSFHDKFINGYCTWETDLLPPSWTDCINKSVREVWCPSTYNAKAFKDSGVTATIRVMPHIFLPKPLPEVHNVRIISKSDNSIIHKDERFNFYTIGEFNARKGIEDIIKAYCKAFTSADSVRLILKVHYKNYSEENKLKCEEWIQAELQKYSNHPPVVCLLDNMTNNEVMGLHSIGDCYVSLTKAEGFGLTIFDAFNYQKKIIVTGYSGHLDYLGTSYPGLVSYKLGPVKGMTPFSVNYTEEQSWAYPYVEHAVELMRGMIK